MAEAYPSAEAGRRGYGRDTMKLCSIEAIAVLIPAAEPLADTLDPVANGRSAIAISLLTDDGIEGVG